MADKFEDFELLYSGKCNGVVPVYKYRSHLTGLTVVIAQVEGPLVNGYFCLATEAHDDDGLPHTLEHLVFMGSENYPFKGVLDLLANRCLASGTNAWTDTDHTCYTMTTAGAEGFMNLLPIYLDHVLYPTLTESAYLTEVHHVNGEGEDAGVVYCEMQGCENTGENRTHLAMVRAMYPGECGYRSETGGMLENLRTSTSHKKVSNYHKEFYRPENLCVVITGQVDPSEVIPVIRPFEEKIASKGELPPYKRPWQSTVPPLEESVEEVIPFPSDDEEHGMVRVAWRTAKAQEFYKMSAIMVLMEYLTDTAVAPLQRDFVEVAEPFCSQVSYSMIENAEGCVTLSFDNVPKSKLKDIKDRVLELLSNIGAGKEEVNMTRMGNVVQRQILDTLSNLEDSPHDTIAFDMIGDFLYGDTKADVDIRLNRVSAFRKLKDEPVEFWVDLLSAYFVGTKHVVIIGEPSQKLMEKMGTKEKERIKAQQQALGEKGLTANRKRVEKAIQDNEEEPPDKMITGVSVPDVERIEFHHIQSSSNHENSAANSNAGFPLANIPVLFQLDDIQTNFVTLTGVLDTGCVPLKLKPYLPLFLEVILESPILREGKLVSHEVIIAELAADTVHSGACLGVEGSRFNCGSFAEVACVELKVELEKYAKGVQWLRELLYAVRLTPDRLKIIATKMLKDVTRMKRKGSAAVSVAMRNLLFTRSSNLVLSSMMRQQTFLGNLLKQLEGRETEVIADMNTLQQLLTRPCNIRIHVAAPVGRLVKLGPAPNVVWEKDFLPEDVQKGGDRPTVKRAVEFVNSDTASSSGAVKRAVEFVNSDTASSSGAVKGAVEFVNSDTASSSGVVVGVGAVESSFLMQATPCVSSFDHDDIPAILVFVQYLTQLEGPMWRQIRGLGLAYHYSMFLKPESGLLYFVLYKSTDVASAYKVAKAIVKGYIDGSTEFSPIELESCKSSLIFELIEKLKTPASASVESLLTYFKGIDHNYNQRLIQIISAVTLDDVKRAGVKYIAPLFDVTKSKCAVCCHPSKVKEVANTFKGLARDMKILNSMEDPFLCSM